MAAPTTSIVIPTRARPEYLRIALASIAPQAHAAGAEVLVVDDAGPTPEGQALAERFGARYEPHATPRGLNVARNTGVERSHGELVVFVDDDVEVAPGWLRALQDAAREHPDVEVFTGPIRPRLEGRAPRSCGREGPPITALDLGEEDREDAGYAWGANMTVRRSALERVGPFDVTLADAGDEQEWQDRWRERPREGGPPPSRAPRGDVGSPSATAGSASAPTEARVRYVAATAPGHRRAGPDSARVRYVAATAPGHRRAGPDSARVRYVAAAALDHRRAGRDARLRSLARAAHARGRAARRFDAWRGGAPALGEELRTLLGCVGHVVRYRCPAGLTMVAHSAGRLRESLRDTPHVLSKKTRITIAHPKENRDPPIHTPPTPTPAPSPTADLPRTDGPHPGNDDPHAGTEDPYRGTEDFLSAESGTVGGLKAVLRGVGDELTEVGERLSGRSARLRRAARDEPPRRRVLAIGVERPEHRALASAAQRELLRSRHEVELCTRPPGSLGKFENLNELLAQAQLPYDWLFVLDDDVVLPRGFLDNLLFLAERFSLDLAQPAHGARSHAAWSVTRRRPGSAVRETRFVEIGPVTLFARSTFAALLPFPALRMGWGLDLHWAAVAREHGWRLGVVDAVAIRHAAAPAASAYSREQAVAEARAFLTERPYVPAREAQATLRTHRRW